MTVNQAKNFKTISIRDFLNDEGGTTFSILPALRMLWLYKWWLLIAALISAAVGLHISTQQTPMYRSKLVMLVQPQFSNLAQVGQGYTSERSYRYYETQYRIIRSRAVIGRVVSKLKLLDGKSYTYPGKSNVLLAAVDILVPGGGYAESQVKPRELRFGTADAAVGYINANLRMVSSDQTELLELQFTSPNAEFSSEVLNAIAQSYKDYIEETKTQRVTQASSWLTEQLAEIKLELREAEQKLQEFRAREGTFDTQNLENSTENNLTELRQNVNLAKLEYRQLLQRYGELHPKLLDAKARLQAAESELARGSSVAVKERGKEFELVQLEGNVESARNLYSMFLQRFQEANMSTDVRLSDATIVDFAKPALRPFNVTGIKTVILSALVGLFGCVGLILLRFHFDNTFKSHVQIERRLGLPVLSVLPTETRLAKSSNRLSPLYRSKNCAVYTESINRIRSALQYANGGGLNKVTQLTSSVEGEGKSTLSLNLAIACSHLGRKTIVIDADMRRPQMQRIVADGSSKTGLSDWLKGDVPLSDAIKTCQFHPDLHVMPAGNRTDEPLELLSSEAFGKLLNSLREHYDHILIDSPPVLPVADGVEIGRKVDGVILVIEAEKTRSDVVKQALAQLEEANVMPLGAVLSKLTERATEYYYPRRYYGTYYDDTRV